MLGIFRYTFVLCYVFVVNWVVRTSEVHSHECHSCDALCACLLQMSTADGNWNVLAYSLAQNGYCSQAILLASHLGHYPFYDCSDVGCVSSLANQKHLYRHVTSFVQSDSLHLLLIALPF